MISKKILNILALLSIIAIIIYFYYNGNGIENPVKNNKKINNKQTKSLNRRKRKHVPSKKGKKKSNL